MAQIVQCFQCSWNGEILKTCTRYWRNQDYRVVHQVGHLGWFDFVLPSCQASSAYFPSGRGTNSPNHSQSNPSIRPDASPCRFNLTPHCSLQNVLRRNVSSSTQLNGTCHGFVVWAMLDIGETTTKFKLTLHCPAHRESGYSQPLSNEL